MFEPGVRNLEFQIQSSRTPNLEFGALNPGFEHRSSLRVRNPSTVFRSLPITKKKIANDQSLPKKEEATPLCGGFCEEIKERRKRSTTRTTTQNGLFKHNAKSRSVSKGEQRLNFAPKLSLRQHNSVLVVTSQSLRGYFAVAVKWKMVYLDGFFRDAFTQTDTNHDTGVNSC